jgi:uncharacterized protein YbjT (DUF2867 family)
MTRRRYAIMGATGHVGRSAVKQLRAAGHDVVAIGRDAAKLPPGTSHGVAAFDDPAALAAAFAGADGVFTMFPPALDVPDVGEYQDRVGEAIRAAVVAARTPRVVSLSSIGAECADPTIGPLAGLHRQEERLDTLDAAVVHLRPGYFTTNFYFSLATIKSPGIIVSSMRGDLPLWMVSTDDVGAAVAKLLDDPTADGPYELASLRQHTLAEATQLLSAALGRPIGFHRVTYEEHEQAMIGFGLPPRVARALVDMNRAHDDGRVGGLTLPLDETLRATTPLAEFMREFAKVCAASGG